MLRALAGAATRELLWGSREVSREVERWRARAASIPDDALRHDALAALEHKRANIDGAALFWTLPRVRSRELLRLLVAYEILADYLDCTSERAADVGTANGRQLHRALIEALDPDLRLSDYYRYHPWARDGGYVRALVGTCRQICARLPSYQAAQTASVSRRMSDAGPRAQPRAGPETARRAAQSMGSTNTSPVSTSSGGLSGRGARAPG